MTWTAETEDTGLTWAGTAFRDPETHRVLWLRAGEDVPEPAWLLQTLDDGDGVRTVTDEQPVAVSDAVAAAPEVAHEVLRVTRAVLQRYAETAPDAMPALAEELRDAARELEREDVSGTARGTHTKRGEDVVPPLEAGG